MLETELNVPLPIDEVARRAGLPPDSLSPYGRYKAKLDHTLGGGARKGRARYVLVTAITPTPAGEGKTVTTIGLSMALNRIGRAAVSTIRQPSMGPVFGVKGGGAGGGASQVVPLEEINLHLTGDFHAVAAANNLLAAALDTSLLLDNPLGLEPERVTWRRVVDMNDRALRQVQIGLGGAQNGVPRNTGFDITAASEVMSVIGLARSRADLRARLERIVIGEKRGGGFATAGELGVAGAMAAILRDALDPTLMQTSEGTPALVHAGPFANISFGNSSVLGDALALRYFDYVVTEAGFGADMGAEKLLNIKCRVSGRSPDVAVLVATVRGLKAHSGRFELKAGAPLPPELLREDLEALELGASNLAAQIQNVRLHGIPVVVAVNRFPSDSERELARLAALALAFGAEACALSELFARGGEGGVELAQAVVDVAERNLARYRPAYQLEQSIEDKIHTIATGLYGAAGVEYSPRASAEIRRFQELGFGGLPICMAKTQYSLS
ncbi:MAG: formate--tetrahydrofolate ligase, partial [Planctomycetes bacterium]|nr:formate--tetrahydrofolate ligase [Planctomycetota bacterium]